MKISYAVQNSPDGLAQAFHIAEDVEFIKDEPCTLVLGDRLGHDARYAIDSTKIITKNIIFELITKITILFLISLLVNALFYKKI